MADFLAGGVSSVMAITLTHPIDVVKSRMQFQGEGARTGSGKAGAGGGVYRGVFSSLAAIGRAEGIRGLYRGLIPAYGLQVSVTGTRFGVYSLAKDFVKSEDGTPQPAWHNFALAALSGFCGAVLGNPFFALKTRAQVFSSAPGLAVGTQHAPSGLLQGLGNIYSEEGLKGYLRGANAFIPRVVVFGAAQLGFYDLCKPFFKDQFHLEEGLQLQFPCAFVASSAAVIAIQPFDFLAARLQNQPVDPLTKRGLLYSGMLDCLHKSIQAEGPSCLLKGCWANACRMGPYSVLVLIFFEQNKRLFAMLGDR